MIYNQVMKKNLTPLKIYWRSGCLFFSPAAVFAAEIGQTEYFNIGAGCGITVEDAPAGSITCRPWEKGSQVKVESIDVGTCICASECLTVPKNHYYYNDPINKTRQTNEQEITLPAVLAWDNVDGWINEEGGYLWQLGGLGGDRSVNSKLFGARSYLWRLKIKILN